VALLAVEGCTVRYGSISAVRNASLTVAAGELVGLIGPNGAGKTSTLSAIAGLFAPAAGTVRLDGHDVTGWSPDKMLRAGLALVPEHRRLFADLTVAENLQVAGVTVARGERQARIDEIASVFPVLGRKWTTAAGYLSGGEAQQLAIARALVTKPKILLMDEPSLGLAPTLVDVVFGLLQSWRGEGFTMLVVEQNATRLLEVADRAYVMRSGEIAAEGPAAELLARADLFDAYVGRGT